MHAVVPFNWWGFSGKILFRPRTTEMVRNAMAQFGIALLRMCTVEDSVIGDLRVLPYGLFGTESILGKPGMCFNAEKNWTGLRPVG
jgi:hypothetical protein